MESKLYVEIAIIAIAVMAFILYVIWQIKKNGLRDVAVKYIVIAEDKFNKGDNQKKLNYVIDKVIAFIPAPFSLFITRELVKELVQSVFDNVKKALDYVPRGEE